MNPAQAKKLLAKLSKSATRFFASEAKLKTTPYRLHRLEQSPAPEITITREEALRMFERMTTIRKMETTASALYKQKTIRGFCHLYSGQEAVAVGIVDSLRPQDALITSYRNHAFTYIFNNFSVDTVIAELVGVKSGNVKGKGGSMHMYGNNFYGGNGIVAAQIPLGVGVSLSLKYREKDAICVTLYGDGAANNGQTYEAYNIAKLWSLPCFFVCENNQYSMGTSVSRGTANPNFYTKGDYIPGIWVDAMDVISVKEATRFAVEYIRECKGPILMEANTYRYFGHSMSDPGKSYRTHEEVQTVRQNRDPITTFKKKIIDANLVTEDELKKVDQKCKNVVEEASKRAAKDKPLDLEELTYDIYSNEVIKEVRGVSPFKKLTHKTSGRAINLK